jgi:(p)ppGpp synthase/HD superfamily hydrolase
MNLEKAIEIASEAHKGQQDRYGAPYLGHVTRVMNSGKTDDERIVGVLHDVIEDTALTFDQLEVQGFSKHIIDAIRCLSKTSDEEDYDEYLERVKTNSLAITVKLYDLTDNMDLRRTHELKKSDVDRFNKYIRAYRMLIAL